MVIVVNTRLLLKNRLEGIGWFTYETLKRITHNHPEHQFIFLFDRPYDKEFVFSGNVKPVIVWPPTRHVSLMYIWFSLRIPGILKKYKADVFVSPDGNLSLHTKIPQLAVIHDINFVHRPKDLPWVVAKYYNYFFPRFARKAQKIVTVSSFSKNDIALNFNIPAHKIEVVFNGCNSEYSPLSKEEVAATRSEYSLGEPYFLFIGALHPRKNVEGLLRAFDLFRSKTNSKEKLLIVGGQMFKTSSISETLQHMQFKDEVIFTGRLPTAELKKVLGGALALTFVPFFEGFGIPVLEAFSAGIPVICSNTTSLPEVGGDAVLYVNPENDAEIAEAMHQISNDAELRSTLIEKGTLQLKKFSWDDSAEKLWKIIELTGRL
jgi:glycosyltransferase involved in cell wall biosynthesis